MGSPALPGLYADPHIAVFGDTHYYIYSTTDGFPSWGGQVFYGWSSKDLVSWTRGAEPLLTLNSTLGNVPWQRMGTDHRRARREILHLLQRPETDIRPQNHRYCCRRLA